MSRGLSWIGQKTLWMTYLINLFPYSNFSDSCQLFYPRTPQHFQHNLCNRVKEIIQSWEVDTICLRRHRTHLLLQLWSSKYKVEQQVSWEEHTSVCNQH